MSYTKECTWTVDVHDSSRGTKTCIEPELYPQYTVAFKREFDIMTTLEEKYPSEYSCFFPQYYECYDPKKNKGENQPYIRMENIKGKCLENVLAEKIGTRTLFPAWLFTPKQLSQFCSQIIQMVLFLYRNGIYYFDLHPCNIIVTNESPLTIKLIDFTSCYYGNSGFFHQLDNRIPSELCPPLRLKYVIQLLFTRLFFAGENCYNQYEGFLSQGTPAAEQTRRFFKQFDPLLNLLFADSKQLECLNILFSQYDKKECCTSIENWIKHLNDHLKRLSAY